MKNLFVLPVAFVAAAFSSSAYADAAKPAASKTQAQIERVSTTAKAEDGADCPYLFGCGSREKTVLDITKTGSIGGKAGADASDAAKSAGKASKVPYAVIIERYASSYGVPLSLAHAVVKIESNYRPNARGSAGEVGLMQIKPATARMMGYSGSTKGLYDPETNIKFGMKYLAEAHRLSGGETCGTILKYNAGHAAKRMNPVSSSYCGKVKVQLAGA
ncbi:transglycosylase SLT domain-containing protein [Corticibacterium sp. UT-5YL-CI-8]|nr:transglycosylase SLT domain-containing protein [Tianweitania sp. UT-5YL-CI-8]